MLKIISGFIETLVGGSETTQAAAPDERLFAGAALLVHVALIDGRLTAGERQWLLDAVKARTGLDGEEAERFVALASQRDREGGDFAAELADLRRKMPAEYRGQLLSLMWRLALADGRLHEFEEAVIDRAADVLGFSAHEAAAIREAAGAA